MKKLVVAAAVMALVGMAQAEDVSVRVGHDNQFHTDVAIASVGTDIAGVHVAGEFDRAGAGYLYNAYGVKVNKDFTVGPVSVGPSVGLAYIDAQTPSLHNKTVATVGLGAGYALNKQVSLVADITQRYDTAKDSKEYRGSMFSLGVKGSF